jgi:hypothetical protein
MNGSKNQVFGPGFDKEGTVGPTPSDTENWSLDLAANRGWWLCKSAVGDMTPHETSASNVYGYTRNLCPGPNGQTTVPPIEPPGPPPAPTPGPEPFIPPEDVQIGEILLGLGVVGFGLFYLQRR